MGSIAAGRIECRRHEAGQPGVEETAKRALEPQVMGGMGLSPAGAAQGFELTGNTCIALAGLDCYPILTQGSGRLRGLHPGLICFVPSALELAVGIPL